MDWQYTLCDLYELVCQRFDEGLWAYCERFSNNNRPLAFTDQEVVTIYLFGIMRQRFTVKAIYHYIGDHLRTWFPRLPTYQTFTDRLNRLGAVFQALLETILVGSDRRGLREAVKLLDSMPVIMAQRGRGDTARVAPELANKGYCSSKNLYYYGVKVHALATRKPGSIPFPDGLGLSPAAAHDLTMARPWLGQLRNCEVFADKIYHDATLKAELAAVQNVVLHTPVKRKKGQACLHYEDLLLSEAVSRVRQPIESLFNWINEKTGIEMASKVRSAKGLIVHVFGKLAAAAYMLVFKP